MVEEGGRRRTKKFLRYSVKSGGEVLKRGEEPLNTHKGAFEVQLNTLFL